MAKKLFREGRKRHLGCSESRNASSTQIYYYTDMCTLSGKVKSKKYKRCGKRVDLLWVSTQFALLFYAHASHSF